VTHLGWPLGGLVFGAVAGRGGEREVCFVEQTGSIASIISGLTFGALAVPVIGESWTPQLVVYAVVSLTAVRMLPVALALAGAVPLYQPHVPPA